MIKAVFFDAAGILYTRAGPTEQFALHLLHENGFDRELYSDQLAHQAEIRSLANRGVLTHTAYWDEFLRLRGVADARQREEYFEAIVAYSNDVQPVPGAREALLQLAERGFRLGIITDTIYPVEWKMRRLEKAGVAEFIEIVACSSALGVHKPDPAVYLHALRQAQLSQGEVLFVGHLGVELDGARNAGMVTVAVNHDPEVRADYYCSSLLDLCNLPILRPESEVKKSEA